jgi:hypothetical protein
MLKVANLSRTIMLWWENNHAFATLMPTEYDLSIPEKLF